jgi:outer membrane immunogenic protein
MHKLMLGSVGFVALAAAGTASAADLPVYKAPPAVCPTCTWGGFYVGANVGGSIGWDRTTDSVSLFGGANTGVTNPIASNTFTHSPAGALGGGQIGFNWQSGNWVYGFEGDFDWAGQRDKKTTDNFIASTIVAAPARIGYSDEQRINWIATARGRLGYTHDCWLWYVTGGGAWAGVESTYSFAATGLNAGGATTFGAPLTGATFHSTKSGWTVGTGVETSLSMLGGWASNLSLKLEYLYVSLGSTTHSFTDPLSNGTGTYEATSRSQIRDHIIRVGVNYRFGAPGLVR